MKDVAEIIQITTFGKKAYQVNIINVRTNLYYNSLSQIFDSKKNAVKYANENNLIIKLR